PAVRSPALRTLAHLAPRVRCRTISSSLSRGVPHWNRAAAASEANPNSMNHNPLIVALDVDDAAQARDLISKLGDSVDFYKIGMELYASAGLDFVREVIGAGKQVFLDLKLFDIGETVKRAVSVVAPTGIRFL